MIYREDATGYSGEADEREHDDDRLQDERDDQRLSQAAERLVIFDGRMSGLRTLLYSKAAHVLVRRT